MAAGLDHSVFLTPKGEVYVTGNNLFGQCGLPESLIREPLKLPLTFEVKQVLASMGTFSGVLTAQQKLYFWGTGSWGYARKCTPIEDLGRVDPNTKVDQVLTGENFALLKIQDSWYIFGQNKMPEDYGTQTHRIPL